jgi:hypothetical protein
MIIVHIHPLTDSGKTVVFIDEGDEAKSYAAIFAAVADYKSAIVSVYHEGEHSDASVPNVSEAT